MELAATVVAGCALAAAVAATLGWRRAVHAADRANRRADTSEERSREQVADTREERAVLDLILSTMDDGILLFGRDGEVSFANSAVGRHLSPEPASLAGVLPLALRSAIEESRARGASTSAVVEVGVPTRWLRGTITPAADDTTLVVVQDVTGQRSLESVRRDFVANASHELKTPASTIQATAETLGRAVKDDPEAVPHFAAQLEREAVRLSRIVADLLDLSRLESGSESADEVSLAATVREEARRLEVSANRAGVALDVMASEELVIRCSRRDLALLVRNVIDNAIRASHEGGAVRVEIASEDDAVLLRVSDTGIGIPSKDLPRIFERFYRVDRARSRETGGTGLGLAIVKHVVENHGGTIEVDSELGRGTAFAIRFPAASPMLHDA